MVVGFGFCGRDVSDWLKQAAVVALARLIHRRKPWAGRRYARHVAPLRQRSATMERHR